MPVINVKKDGKWQDIASTYTHAHTISDITDLPQGFVDDYNNLKDKVGGTPVADQINIALSTIKPYDYEHPFTHPASMIIGLSKIATTGSYNDLIDTPNMPNELDLLPKQIDIDFEMGTFLGSSVYASEFNFAESGETNNIVDSFDLEPEEVYFVEWDGKRYNVVAEDISSIAPYTLLLGNGDMFGLDIKSEPFAITYVANKGIQCFDAANHPLINGNYVLSSKSVDGMITDVKYHFYPGTVEYDALQQINVGDQYVIKYGAKSQIVDAEDISSQYTSDGATVTKAISLNIPNDFSINILNYIKDDDVVDVVELKKVMIMNVSPGLDYPLDVSVGVPNSHSVRIYKESEFAALPEFNSDDEGKVLSIKDGAVMWTEPPAGSGGASVTEVDIFPEARLTGFEPSSQFGGAYAYGAQDYTTPFDLAVGDTCVVVWDGDEWPVVVQDAGHILEDNLVLGNGSLFNLDSKGEPFGVAWDTEYGCPVFVAWTSTEESHTVRIYKKVEVEAQTIPKFTSNDEGKVLSVKDGVLAWTKTSGGTTVSEVDIIPEGSYIFYRQEESIFALAPYSSPDNLEIGEEYAVVLDDIEYSYILEDIRSIIPNDILPTEYVDKVLLLGNKGLALTIMGVSHNYEITEDALFIVAIIASEAGVAAGMQSEFAMYIIDPVSEEDLVTKKLRVYQKGSFLVIPEFTSDDEGKVLSVKDGELNWSVSSQSNWNQTDDSAADFIKNKPFGEYEGEVDVLPLTRYENFTLDEDFGYSKADMGLDLQLKIGESYTVYWDEVEYKDCVAQDASFVMDGAIAIGNLSALNPSLSGNNEPFIIGCVSGFATIYMAITDIEAGNSHYIRITKSGTVTKCLDNKYLSFMDYIPEVREDILPLTTYENFTLDEDFGIYFKSETAKYLLTIGETYKVYWDGDEHQCVAQDASALMPGTVCLGNLSAFGLSGNNEKFVIGFIPANNLTVYFSLTDTEAGGSHDVRISKITDEYYAVNGDCISSISWDKISDKPFGTIPAGTIVVKETTVNCNILFENNTYAAVLEEKINIIGGLRYHVEFDGNNYGVMSEQYGEEAVIECNDFAILTVGSAAVFVSTQGEHTFKITFAEDVITKIDSIYLSSTLPEITADDNNKTLVVSDGAWTVAEPAKGVPEVTSEDNGKFLRVVDGVWSAATVLNAEEVAF